MGDNGVSMKCGAKAFRSRDCEPTSDADHAEKSAAHLLSLYSEFEASYPALAQQFGHEPGQLHQLETFADWRWIMAERAGSRAHFAKLIGMAVKLVSRLVISQAERAGCCYGADSFFDGLNTTPSFITN
jgi:hypothetical protein